MAIGDPAAGKPMSRAPFTIGSKPLPTQTTKSCAENLVLSSIAQEEYDLLLPHLELVGLPQYEILFEQAERIAHVFFPCSGMVSLVVLASDGRSVEVGIVGREGIVGTARSVGLSRSSYRAISQIPGHAMRVRGDILEDLLPSMPDLRLAFGRFTLMQGLQVAQLAACNRLHEIDQRLARWLLMCQDRVQHERLLLTHEFLAQMLGTGRPSVSLAAGALEREGLIENGRGSIRIVNRPGLENAACECYGVVHRFNCGLGLNGGSRLSDTFVAEQTAAALPE